MDMTRKHLDFCIEEAGCLLWVAPRSLGGLSAAELGQVWMGGHREVTTEELVRRGAMMPLALYQDDGYVVRFILGDLNEQEAAEWTSRAIWKLDAPCGEILVSGVLTPDFQAEFATMVPAEANGSYWLGAYIAVPPGAYLVEIHGYPPGDLSGGWGTITEPRMFGAQPGIQPEKPLEYWWRTHPDETPPGWMADEPEEEGSYVDFIIRLSPLEGEMAKPALEEDGCLQWEFRKPDICPAGIRSSL